MAGYGGGGYSYNGGSNPGYSNSSGSSSQYSHSKSESTNQGASTGTPTQMPSPQTDFSLQIAQIMGQLGGYVNQWAQGVWNNVNDITQGTVDQLMSAGQKAYGMADTMQGQFTNTGLPEMQNQAQQASQYSGYGRQQFNMGQAEAGAANAGATALNNTKMQLAAYGVNPGSPGYAEALAATNAATGASEAGAGTQARINTEQTGRNLQQQSIANELTLPSAVVNSQNQGYQATAGAANAGNAGANTGINLANSPVGYYSNAEKPLLPPVGQTTNQANSGQSQSYTNSKGSAVQSSQGQTGNNNPSHSQQYGTQPGSGGGGSGGAGSGGAGAGSGASGGSGGDSGGVGGNTGTGDGGDASSSVLPGGTPSGQGGIGSDSAPNTGNGQAGGGFTGGPIYGGGGIGSDTAGNAGNGGVNSDPLGGGLASDQAPPAAQNMEQAIQEMEALRGADAAAAAGGGGGAGSEGGGSGAGGPGTDVSGTSGTSIAVAGGGDPGRALLWAKHAARYAGGGPSPPQGVVDMSPTMGGHVPPQASPSMGAQTDDIHAKLNAGEFVIPRDVAMWKGQEFFQKLIDGARRKRMMGSAQGKPTSPPQGPVRFSSGVI